MELEEREKAVETLGKGLGKSLSIEDLLDMESSSSRSISARDKVKMEMVETVESSYNDEVSSKAESRDSKSDIEHEVSIVPQEQVVGADDWMIEMGSKEQEKDQLSSQDKVDSSQSGDNDHKMTELELMKSDVDERQLQLEEKGVHLANKEIELKKREEALEINEARLSSDAEAREDNIRSMEKSLDESKKHLEALDSQISEKSWLQKQKMDEVEKSLNERELQLEKERKSLNKKEMELEEREKAVESLRKGTDIPSSKGRFGFSSAIVGDHNTFFRDKEELRAFEETLLIREQAIGEEELSLCNLRNDLVSKENGIIVKTNEILSREEKLELKEAEFLKKTMVSERSEEIKKSKYNSPKSLHTKSHHDEGSEDDTCDPDNNLENNFDLDLPDSLIDDINSQREIVDSSLFTLNEFKESGVMNRLDELRHHESTFRRQFAVLSKQKESLILKESVLEDKLKEVENKDTKLTKKESMLNDLEIQLMSREQEVLLLEKECKEMKIEYQMKQKYVIIQEEELNMKLEEQKTTQDKIRKREDEVRSQQNDILSNILSIQKEHDAMVGDKMNMLKKKENEFVEREKDLIKKEGLLTEMTKKITLKEKEINQMQHDLATQLEDAKTGLTKSNFHEANENKTGSYMEEDEKECKLRELEANLDLRKSELDSIEINISKQNDQNKENEAKAKILELSIQEKISLINQLKEKIKLLQSKIKTKSDELKEREDLMESILARKASIIQEKEAEIFEKENELKELEIKLKSKRSDVLAMGDWKKIDKELRKRTDELKKKEMELQTKTDYFEQKVSRIMKMEDDMQKNLVGILSKTQPKHNGRTSSDDSDDLKDLMKQSHSHFSITEANSKLTDYNTEVKKNDSSDGTLSIKPPIEVAVPNKSRRLIDKVNDDSSFNGILPPGFKNITFVGGRSSSYKPLRFSNNLGTTIRPAIQNLKPCQMKPVRKHHK